MDSTKYSIKVISIRWFTDKELMILVKLADDRGHALWDLEEKTGIAKSNLKPKIDSLLKKRAIYKGAIRKTRNKISSHPKDTEQPYYIRPKRYFIIRRELRTSVDETQSKLLRKEELAQTPKDEEAIKKLRNKLDLYYNLLLEFESSSEPIRNKPPRDHRLDKDVTEEETSEDSEIVFGAFERWSPVLAEARKIAEDIAEYCIDPSLALLVAFTARQDLYAAHDKWIMDHLPKVSKDT